MNNTPARKLAAIKQVLDDRVEIWIDIIEPDGTCSERIHRGHFQRNPPAVVSRPLPPTRRTQ
jgi:hypothetical protein